MITELTQGWGNRLLGHKQNFECTRIQKKGALTPQETESDLPVSVLESLAEAWVDSGLPQGQGLWMQDTWSHSLWHKPSWRRLPLTPPQSRQADDPQTAEQLYQINSCTVKKVLGPTTDFPISGDLAKGLRTSREFDFGGQWNLIIELTQDWRNRLGGHKQNLVCTRTQEKGAVTPQETDPGLPVSIQESPQEAWVSDGLLQGRRHLVQQCGPGTF